MPSASALVYAFGDMFVEKASVGLFGEEVPCRNIKVHRKNLARTMVLAAYMNLSEAGSISLQAAKEKQLMFMTVDVVNVTVKEAPTNGAVLERGIVDNVTGGKGDNVRNIVYRYIGQDVDDPWGTIIRVARQELLGSGYFNAEKRSGVGKILGDKLVPVCEKLGGLESEARELKARLDAFQKRDPQLFTILSKQIDSAISSRQKQNDTSD